MRKIWISWAGVPVDRRSPACGGLPPVEVSCLWRSRILDLDLDLDPGKIIWSHFICLGPRFPLRPPDLPPHLLVRARPPRSCPRARSSRQDTPPARASPSSWWMPAGGVRVQAEGSHGSLSYINASYQRVPFSYQRKLLLTGFS